MRTTVNITEVAKNFDWLARVKDDPTRAEYAAMARERIAAECAALPHGSGIDNGCNFDFEESRPQRLVFTLSYHHMNEGGFYDGWTFHKVILTPVFGGYNMRITGPDRNGVKEYLRDVFNNIFSV